MCIRDSGAAIESVWGPKKFLTYYILTGLGAAVAHYAIVYYQMQPAIAFLNDYIDAPSMTKLQGLINSDAFTNFSSREMLEHYNSFTASFNELANTCLLYTSPSPRDRTRSRMPSSA